jgi:hypothetical protein
VPSNCLRWAYYLAKCPSRKGAIKAARLCWRWTPLASRTWATLLIRDRQERLLCPKTIELVQA